LAHILDHVQAPCCAGRAYLLGHDPRFHYRAALVPQNIRIESNLSFGKGRTGTPQKSHAATYTPTPPSSQEPRVSSAHTDRSYCVSGEA
jgi:hypothetical protein